MRPRMIGSAASRQCPTASALTAHDFGVGAGQLRNDATMNDAGPPADVMHRDPSPDHEIPPPEPLTPPSEPVVPPGEPVVPPSEPVSFPVGRGARPGDEAGNAATALAAYMGDGPPPM